MTILATTAILMAMAIPGQPATFVVGVQDADLKPVVGAKILVSPPRTPHAQKSDLPPVEGITGPDGTVTLDWGQPFDGSGTVVELTDTQSPPRFPKTYSYGLGAYDGGLVHWLGASYLSAPVYPTPIPNTPVSVAANRDDWRALLSSLTTGVATDQAISKRLSLAIAKALSK